MTSNNHDLPEVIRDNCGRRKFSHVVGELARRSFPIRVGLNNDAVAYLNRGDMSAHVGWQCKRAKNETS